MLIPGATGDSEGGHIGAMAAEAYRNGFNIIIVNPIAPRNSSHMKDLEVIDYTKTLPIAEAVVHTKEIFGETDLYAMGFSLGSNHLLRHLGAHKNCKEECGFKAAVSVSSAFELPATGIEL